MDVKENPSLHEHYDPLTSASLFLKSHFTGLSSFWYGRITYDTTYLKLHRDITDEHFIQIVDAHTNLKVLSLRGCWQLTIEGLLALKELSQLEALDLSGCSGIINRELLFLYFLPQLKSLNLGGCQKLTEQGLSVLGSLRQLESLNLQGCSQLTDEELLPLCDLTQLKSLDLTCCSQLTVRGVCFLLGQLAKHGGHLRECVLPNREILRGEQIQRYVEEINEQPAATSLIVSRTITPEDFIQIVNDHPNLKALVLRKCSELSKDEFLSCLWKLDHLESLDLSDSQLTDEGLFALSTLTQLKSLDLDYCRQITDEGLFALSTLTRLKSVVLNGCVELTDAGLYALSTLTRLKSLELHGCHKLTDEGLFALSTLTQLKFLDLGYCRQITDDGLSALSACVQLVTLGLELCMGLTDEGICSLLSHLAGHLLVCVLPNGEVLKGEQIQCYVDEINESNRGYTFGQ